MYWSVLEKDESNNPECNGVLQWTDDPGGVELPMDIVVWDYLEFEIGDLQPGITPEQIAHGLGISHFCEYDKDGYEWRLCRNVVYRRKLIEPPLSDELFSVGGWSEWEKVCDVYHTGGGYRSTKDFEALKRDTRRVVKHGCDHSLRSDHIGDEA